MPAELRLDFADGAPAAAGFLLVGPWLCLVASPYAFGLSSYYAVTVFNHDFAKYLSQWAPTTFSPISLSKL